MKSRTLLWILLAAALGGAAQSVFMAGAVFSEPAAYRPNDQIDESIDESFDDPSQPSRRGRAGQPPRGQFPTGQPGPSDPLSAEQIASLPEPGEHHEHLGLMAGDWDLQIRIWSAPEAEPIESAGTAEARWILDGRFLWTIYRAELFGKPFEAWSIEGFDNQTQQYVGTWRDTQGTYTLIYFGKCKLPPLEEGESRVDTVPDGRYREMTTQITDPASGERLDIRTELRISDDSFVQESFVVLSVEESIKNLELVGTRRSG